MVTVARMPSAVARSRIRSASATPPPRDARAFRRLNSSVAAKAKWTSSSPLAQPVVAALVHREAGVDDALAPLDRRDHLLRSGHLRHVLRADEAGRLDARQAGGREPVDELGAFSGASVTGWFWSPSLGPTSQIVTLIRPHPPAIRRAPVGEAEQAAVDLLVVAPLLPRARPPHLARRVRELGHDARPEVRPELRDRRARPASRAPCIAGPRRSRPSCRSARRRHPPR